MAKLLLRNIRSKKRRAAILDLESKTRKEIDSVMNKKVKPALIKSHELITANWEHQVKFQARTTIDDRAITVYVFPTGQNKEIWLFVDQGTKPHVIENIVPKKAKSLKFQLGGTYNPKTLAKPARTVPSGGSTTGGVTVYAKRVERIEHPGNEGRFFSKQIGDDILPDFRKEIENAFGRIAKQVEE